VEGWGIGVTTYSAGVPVMYRQPGIVTTGIDITVVIPARNEEDNIYDTVMDLVHQLSGANILYEIIVIDDHSADHTSIVARRARASVYRNPGLAGYGRAVRFGLERAHGQYVTVMVADGSDRADDLVRMMLALRFVTPSTAVFGHRFMSGSKVTDYPRVKRVANRLGNHLAARLFNVKYSDLTNPFKVYPTQAVKELLPIVKATDFSFGFELCCRYILAGGRWVPISISWQDRVKGSSKFKVKHAVGFLKTLYRVYTHLPV
jgi:glycosyltransferase involved in cell wall biosynthesis